jgi:hypothetical protein
MMTAQQAASTLAATSRGLQARLTTTVVTTLSIPAATAATESLFPQGWLTGVVSSVSKVMSHRRRTLGLGLALKCGTPEGAGDVRDGKTNNSDLSSLCNSLPPS